MYTSNSNCLNLNFWNLKVNSSDGVSGWFTLYNMNWGVFASWIHIPALLFITCQWLNWFDSKGEFGLILNTNLPLLPSYWGFSYALGHGVSPHSHSSAYHLTRVSLTLDVGYLLKASPAKCSRCWLYASNRYAKIAYLRVSHYRVRGKWLFSPYQALDFLAAV